MKKQNHAFFGVIFIVIAAGLLVLGSSGHTTTPKNNTCTCCKQNLKDCAGKNNRIAPGEPIMESLSRQFLSLTSPAY